MEYPVIIRNVFKTRHRTLEHLPDGIIPEPQLGRSQLRLRGIRLPCSDTSIPYQSHCQCAQKEPDQQHCRHVCFAPLTFRIHTDILPFLQKFFNENTVLFPIKRRTPGIISRFFTFSLFLLRGKVKNHGKRWSIGSLPETKRSGTMELSYSVPDQVPSCKNHLIKEDTT